MKGHMVDGYLNKYMCKVASHMFRLLSKKIIDNGRTIFKLQ